MVVQSTMWRGLLSVTAVSLLAVRACSRAGRWGRFSGVGSSLGGGRVHGAVAADSPAVSAREAAGSGGGGVAWRRGSRRVVGEPERGLVQGSGQLPAGEAGAESGTERVQNLREQVRIAQDVHRDVVVVEVAGRGRVGADPGTRPRAPEPVFRWCGSAGSPSSRRRRRGRPCGRVGVAAALIRTPHPRPAPPGMRVTGVWHQGQIPGSAPPPRAFAVFPPAVSVFSCDDERGVHTANPISSRRKSTHSA